MEQWSENIITSISVGSTIFSKDKIYSLHEPNVKCYSKGKEHKKFEFGSKSSILVDQSTGIIMGALNFTQTLHDFKTLREVFEQYERLTGEQAGQVLQTGATGG